MLLPLILVMFATAVLLDDQVTFFSLAAESPLAETEDDVVPTVTVTFVLLTFSLEAAIAGPANSGVNATVTTTARMTVTILMLKFFLSLILFSPRVQAASTIRSLPDNDSSNLYLRAAQSLIIMHAFVKFM